MTAGTLTLHLRNDLSELATLSGNLEEFATTLGLSKRTLFQLNLVIDELVTNIINYAYRDDAEHQITVMVRFEEGSLVMRVEDDGIPFNPILSHHIDRLAEDHEHAALLAEGLAKHSALRVAPHQTNMVFVDVPAESAGPLAAHLEAEGVRLFGTARQRWVTHLDVARPDVERAIASVDRFFARRGSAVNLSAHA